MATEAQEETTLEETEMKKSPLKRTATTRARQENEVLKLEAQLKAAQEAVALAEQQDKEAEEFERLEKKG